MKTIYAGLMILGLLGNAGAFASGSDDCIKISDVNGIKGRTPTGTEVQPAKADAIVVGGDKAPAPATE